MSVTVSRCWTKENHRSATRGRTNERTHVERMRFVRWSRDTCGDSHVFVLDVNAIVRRNAPKCSMTTRRPLANNFHFSTTTKAGRGSRGAAVTHRQPVKNTNTDNEMKMMMTLWHEMTNIHPTIYQFQCSNKHFERITPPLESNPLRPRLFVTFRTL